MARNFNTNTENCETWLTPPELIKALGTFDLDPCTPVEMPWNTAGKMLSQERDGDGLSAEWNGRVWLNPPYGRKTFAWLAKLAKHKSGIALIFARTETKGFQREVFRKAHCVFFSCREAQISPRRRHAGRLRQCAELPRELLPCGHEGDFQRRRGRRHCGNTVHADVPLYVLFLAPSSRRGHQERETTNEHE